MVGIEEGQVHAFVEASTLQRTFELEYWHTKHLTIKCAAFRFEAFQLLDGYVRIMLECKVRDVSDDFSNAVLNKVLFSPSELLETSAGTMAALV